MNKIISRDYKVAILYSPGYGTGWSTANRNTHSLLYDPETVVWVESGKRNVCAYMRRMKDRFPFAVISENAIKNLEVAWLPVGTEFRIEEYDGHETIVRRDQVQWEVA